MKIDTSSFDGHFMIMKKEGGDKPRILHGSKSKAERESVRLSKKNNGETFLVLQIVGRSKSTAKPKEVINERHSDPAVQA